MQRSLRTGPPGRSLASSSLLGICDTRGTLSRVPAKRAIGLAVDTVGSYGREVLHGVMEFCHRNPHWVIAMEPPLWVYDRPMQPEKWNVDGLIVQAHSQDAID